MVIIPALHPAFILRQNARFSGLVELAFERAIEAVRGKVPRWDESEFILPGPGLDAAKVEEVLSSMHGKQVAFDVETDGRHPLECSLRCIAFYDGKRAITVPLLYRDGTKEAVQVLTSSGKLKTEHRAVWKPYFSGEALKRVVKAIRGVLLGAGQLITQNGQYDRLVVKSQLGIDAPTGFDTIIAHHIVAPYLPHDLGFLGALYTDVPYYKATDAGDSWASESDEELWRYNARDVKVTWLVAKKLEEELKELPQNAALFEHDTWQERECQRWQEVGVELDPYALAFFRQHYRRIAARALRAMREVVERQLKRAGKAGTEGAEALEALLNKLSEKADEELFDDAGEVVEYFNPASLQQLRLLLAGLGVPLTERTATGEVSTAKEFLTGARKELLAQGVPPDDDRVAFLDYLFAWREATKVESTYLYPEVLKDGRVHPSFSVHVTPTGRLCIAGWTPVRTHRGVIPLADVRVGDLVWTHQRRWRRVTAVHYQGVKDVLDAKLSNGYVVTATTDHRFLGADGRWVTLGELHERLEKLACRSGEPGSGSKGLQKPRLADARASRPPAWNDIPKRPGCAPDGAASGGPQNFGEAQVLGLEDRQEKPHVREEGREAPPLEGRVRGPEGLPHMPLAGKAPLRPPHRDDEGVEAEVHPEGYGRPPHRWGQDEQRFGQPRALHGEGSPGDSLEAVQGLPGVEVEEVHPRGRVETFDLSVEEDESFEAAGVFSHNSSQRPNFQNQPPEIRGMYVARKGHVLVSMDWDALEMRLGAFNSEDPNYIKAFVEYDEGRGPKPHIVNMSVIFGVPATKEAAEQYPHLYRAAKVFAYAGAYGASDLTMYEQMREEMPDLKLEAFRAALANYKKRYAQLFRFQDQVVMQGTREGFLDSGILKRRSYYFEPAVGQKSPEASAMQNFPYQSTGADVVGLANRRIMERLVIPWRKKLKAGEVIEQLAQVHDELLFEVPERLAKKFIKELKRIAEEPPPGKPHWRLPVDIKARRRWKPVQTRCPKCRELTEVEMTKPHHWEGKCSKGHEVKVVVEDGEEGEVGEAKREAKPEAKREAKR